MARSRAVSLHRIESATSALPDFVPATGDIALRPLQPFGLDIAGNSARFVNLSARGLANGGFENKTTPKQYQLA
jgi:hypothetical protein